MLTNLTEGIVVFLAFVAFPFLLISGAAILLGVLDHFAHRFLHQNHNHSF